MSKFARAVERYGGRKAVAEALGLTYERVRQLEGDAELPTLPLAFEIKKLLNVPVSYWESRAAERSNPKSPA